MTRWIVFAALLLAACGAQSNPAPPQRNPPTLEAPGWRQALEPVTAENAASVALLGRLDQPETPGTLFEHVVSPDSTRLVALSSEEVYAWDLLTGELIFRTARANYTRLFYAPDMTELYAVDPNGYVSILDAETGSTRNSFSGHASYSGALAFDSGTARLALGGRDGTVRIWELFERRALITLRAHENSITALAFSAGGAQLASAESGAARLWDWQNGEQLAELGLTVGEARQLALALSGDQAAVGTQAGAWLWTLAGASQSRLLTVEHGTTDLLRYSPDGALLLGGSRTGGLSLWNAATGEHVGTLSEVRGSQISADFSPDSMMLLTSALGGSVALWDLSQTDQPTVARAQLPLVAQQIYAVHWMDDSRLLLLFDATGPVYAWGIG